MDALFFAVVLAFQVNSAGNVIGSGTAFFFTHNEAVYLITNEHVVKFSEKDPGSYLVIKAHTDDQYKDLTKLVDIRIDLNKNGKLLWHSPGNNIDIAAIRLKDTGADFSKVSIISITENNFPSTEDLLVEPADPVVVYGYPLGFYDVSTFAPSIKSGIIASLYAPFNGQPYFLLDADLMPGMSGGPVLTGPSTIRKTKAGIANTNSSKRFFLGIHSATYYMRTGTTKEPIYKEVDSKIVIDGMKEVPIQKSTGLQYCWFPDEIVKLIKSF